MHPISSAQKENILSLASHGHPTHSIAKKTGLGKSTVIRTLHAFLWSSLQALLPSPTCYPFTNHHGQGFQCSSGHQTHQYHHSPSSQLTDSYKCSQETFIQGCHKEEKAIGQCNG